MKRTSTRTLPPQLVALANYAVEYPSLERFERAVTAATQILGTTDSFAREQQREGFIQRESAHPDDDGLTGLTPDQHAAAQCVYGDAGYCLGFAMAYRLLVERAQG
jgi:hypothetical protein